jgi:hypothetical protein
MAAIGGDWYASRCTHGNKPCPQSDDTVRFVYSTQPDGEKYIVAKVWSGDNGDYESTARLVAAAPELLRELKFAVSVLQDNHIARGVAAALAAIRLAEGGEE